MTRHTSHLGVISETQVASLPTSRHATGGELGVLAALRGLAPRRALTPDEAETVAEEQAERLVQLAGLSAPPVPSALVAELPRILVRTDADLGASGASQWINGRWLILINSSEPLARQRYSLAHEYKHCLDHRYRTPMYLDRPNLTALNQAELAADAFAAALLMPAAWVRDAWRTGERRLTHLSTTFGVSPRAMARRLDHLGLRALPRADTAHRREAA